MGAPQEIVSLVAKIFSLCNSIVSFIDFIFIYLKLQDTKLLQLIEWLFMAQFTLFSSIINVKTRIHKSTPSNSSGK
jgi:hypothetical protein